MSHILLSPLNDLHSLSQTLFLSLSPIQSKPPPPPKFTSFLACDQALSSAINLAHTHQIKQRRIESLKTEILNLEIRWRETCMELEDGKRELDRMIKEGQERIKAIDEAKKGMFFSRLSLGHVLHRTIYSIYTLPRTPYLRPKPQRVHISTAKHARSQPSWPASPAAILSSVS